jgi:predicted porin
MGGFGEFRMGRDYVPTFTVHTKYDPFGTNGLGSSISMYGGLMGGFSSSAVRANNSLGYLGKFGSFDVAYMYGLRESATTNGDYHGIRVGYNAGPLSMDVATASEVGVGAANVNPRRTNFGVAYDFGFIKPMFQYTTTKIEQAGGDTKLNNVLLGLTAPVGPGLLRFSYVRSARDVAGVDTDGKQVALGYTYPLSKRTSFNANIARISADAAFPSGDQTGYEIGVRHTF